jgi:hypothetical protein
MIIQTSWRKDKRFVAIFSNGQKIHFGSPSATTYIDGVSEAKKHAYLARHGKNNENWDNPYTAGSLSRFLLWGDSPNLFVNIKAFIRQFNI